MTTASKRALEWEPAGVAVDRPPPPRPAADAGERLEPRERVERVTAEEVVGALDRPALALVLEAPVRLGLRLLREVEVEVRRQPRRPRRAREHDAQDVRMLVVADEDPEGEQLGSCSAARTSWPM